MGKGISASVHMRLVECTSLANMIWIFVACGAEDPGCPGEHGEGTPLGVN
jgi:hypothetical protein